MKFVCDSSVERGMAVLLALNPVTKTEVKLNPPFLWDTREQLDEFARRFETHCISAWEFARLDVNEVNTSTWPNHLPSSPAGDDVVVSGTASDGSTSG